MAGLFDSYCDDGVEWLDPLVRARRLELWDDSLIRVGDDWQSGCQPAGQEITAGSPGQLGRSGAPHGGLR
jgi:hypothetical protein